MSIDLSELVFNLSMSCKGTFIVSYRRVCSHVRIVISTVYGSDV